MVAMGKPRPAVIVQTDAITTSVEILICPFTTTSLDASLYRITIEPSPNNALNASSQLMTDKVGPALQSRIGGIIGHLDEVDIMRLNVALTLVLDLGG